MTVVVDSQGNRRYVEGIEARSWRLSGSRPQQVSQPKGLSFEQLDFADSYAGIYGSQPAVFALVNKLARGIARMPAKSYVRNADGGRERLGLDEHPLAAVIERPYPRGSRFKLFEATVGNVAVYGNGLWWKWRAGPGQPPSELWPLDWRYMSIVKGGDSPIDLYRYDGPAGRKLFLPSEVVHFQFWSPRGPEGTSPLEPLRETLALEAAGRRYAISSFAHGVRPSGALVTEQELGAEQKEELRAELEVLNAGPDNAFRMALLDGGLDWKTFSHTAQEAQTIEHRTLNAYEAARVYDIPPPAIGLLDRATYSNITEQHAMLYQDSFGPWFTMLEETIGAELIAPEVTFDGTYVEFDLAEILRPDMAARAAAYVQLRQAGGITANQILEAENRPRVDHPAADAILLPLNMAAVGDGFEQGLDGGGGAEQGLASAIRRLVDEALEQRAASANGHVDDELELGDVRGGG